MKKYCKDNEVLPRGYAPAWYDYAARRAVCYPLGIHLAVALARWVYYRVAISTHYIESRRDVFARLEAEFALRNPPRKAKWPTETELDLGLVVRIEEIVVVRIEPSSVEFKAKVTTISNGTGGKVVTFTTV